MAQRHRKLDGVQAHSAKGDVSGQRAMEAMEEEDTEMSAAVANPRKRKAD